MSWCSEVSLCSKCWGFCGFCHGFSSSLLDSYYQESWAWSWAGSGAGSGGGAAFFAGATGLGLDEAPDGAAGPLAKRSCLFLESKMVAICGEQVSPGDCSRPFNQQWGVPVLAGSREAKGDQCSAEDQRVYLSLGQKMLPAPE